LYDLRWFPLAKIKGPLFSLDAAGSVGKELTYAVKKGNKIGLKYSEPGDKVPFESSPRQKDQRSIIGLITAHWKCLPSEEKLSWEVEAKTKRFRGTGYHYFLHLAKTDLISYLGLVCFWTFNYNVRDSILDLSGNENKGYLKPNFPINCPVLVDSFDKKHGQCLYFDGYQDWFTVPTSPSLALNDTDGLTLEIWFKSPIDLIPVSASGFLCSFYAYNQKGFFLQTRFGSLSVTVHGGGASRTLTGVKKILQDKWYLLTLTHKNRYSSLYINGELDRRLTTWTMGTTTNIPFELGQLFLYFEGYMENVRVYNRVLSPEEIKRHYDLLI